MTLPPDDGPDDLKKAIGDVDPLKWLESLAARQGANPEEFLTSADLDVPEVDPSAVVDEPGYSDYDPFGGSRPEEKPARPPETPRPGPEAGPPPDVNPLAWLESLARRQGANPEEFITDANLEVEEVSPDAVVDEPGYTPYNASAPEPVAPPERAVPPGRGAPSRPAKAPVRRDGELTAEEAAAILGLESADLRPVEAELEAAEAEPTPVADPLAAGVDPLAWLESLARRQGAPSEELITAADVEVPTVPAGAVTDEPGYVDYSPFSALTDHAEEEEEGFPAEIAAAEPPPSGDDTLAWLEGLAAAQEAAAPAPSDPLAGLSDDQIERMAAAGELSVEQMEAWLRRQVDSLARAREMGAMAEEELPPAEPASIPDWLQEARPLPGAQPTRPPEPALKPVEIPDWLQTPEPVEDDSALLRILAEAADTALEEEEPPVELEDSWAMALEAEYRERQQPSAEEPEWYRAALEDAERQAELEERLAAATAPVEEPAAQELPPAEEQPEEAAMPAWMQEAAASLDEMPAWLTEEIPAAEAAATPVDNWMADVGLDSDTAAIPGWLLEPVPEAPAVTPVAETPVAETPAPEPVVAAAPAAETPPVVPEPTPVPARAEPAALPAAILQVLLNASIPEGAAYDIFRKRLAADPGDHATRLALARRLLLDNNTAASLNHYEALAFAEVLLPDLERDLRALVQRQPALPQARRVLGDVFMREGRLQEALETYRAALEQL